MHDGNPSQYLAAVIVQATLRRKRGARSQRSIPHPYCHEAKLPRVRAAIVSSNYCATAASYTYNWRQTVKTGETHDHL